MEAARPSELEMQVLGVLWEGGPATVRQISERLPDGKPRAYTTVLTVMQGMQRKGLVSPTRDGQTHVFHPTVERGQIARPVLKTLMQNLFGGDPSRAVQALLDSTDVSDTELKQIRRVINDAARRSRDGGGSK